MASKKITIDVNLKEQYQKSLDLSKSVHSQLSKNQAYEGALGQDRLNKINYATAAIEEFLKSTEHTEESFKDFTKS